MKTFRFLDFKVYQDSKLFYKQVVVITKTFTNGHFDLTDQMRRASLSICLNIAEGSAKKSDKDFARFLENSLGSVNECVAGLDCALSLDLISESVFQKLSTEAEEIANQLGGFEKKLRKSTVNN